MHVPRDYQLAAETAADEGFQRHDSVALQMATGTGKTVVFVRMMSKWKEGRTMVICPQIVLVDQTAKKIQKETGIYPAIEQGMRRSNEATWARNDFIVASKQSLCAGRNGTKRFEKFSDVGLVICDEAHYCATEAYAEMLRYFRENGAKLLLVSATLKRHDNKAMGQLCDEVVFDYPYTKAKSEGWLVPARTIVRRLDKMDLSDIDVTKGFWGTDLNPVQLNERLEQRENILAICEAVAEPTRNLKTAIFCPSVKMAQFVSECLSDRYGINARWICADTRLCSPDARQQAMDGFVSGRVTHLCNVGILTTGWDFPGLEAIVMARFTKSKPLFLQIFGRGTRPLEGVVDGPFDAATRKDRIAESAKPHILVLDLVDNSASHAGTITSIDLLGGEWDLVKRQEILEKAAGGDEIDVEEEGKAHDEAARKKLAAAAVKAKFIDREVDIFGEDRVRPNKDSVRVGPPASQSMLRCLYALGMHDIRRYQVSRRQAMRMIGQLKKGLTSQVVRRSNKLRPINEGVPKPTTWSTAKPIGKSFLDAARAAAEHNLPLKDARFIYKERTGQFPTPSTSGMNCDHPAWNRPAAEFLETAQ